MRLLILAAILSPSLAVGPLISEGWTPVERSRIVQLPQNYEQPSYKPQIQQGDQSPRRQNERIDIVENPVYVDEEYPVEQEVVKATTTTTTTPFPTVAPQVLD